MEGLGFDTEWSCFVFSGKHSKIEKEEGGWGWVFGVA